MQRSQVCGRGIQQREHFRGDARLSTWLYAITRNHCLSAIRKMAADPVDTGESLPFGLRDLNAAEPARDVEKGQLNRRLSQMLNAALEPGARVVLHDAHPYKTTLPAMRHMGLELGFADFEGRNYQALMRHLSLCLVAMGFAAEHTDRLREKKYGDHVGASVPGAARGEPALAAAAAG